MLTPSFPHGASAKCFPSGAEVSSRLSLGTGLTSETWNCWIRSGSLSYSKRPVTCSPTAGRPNRKVDLTFPASSSLSRQCPWPDLGNLRHPGVPRRR